MCLMAASDLLVAMSGEQSENAHIGSQCENQSFRILVIGEDETDWKIIIRNIRRAWPFEHQLAWESAADGNEAMTRLAHSLFTMAILDWQVPNLRGMDVLRKLRASGVNIPVIVVSGLDRKEIADDLESLGAVFLNKEGINPTALRDAVATSARWLADGLARKPKGRERKL
jgi:CheY-like chemotaxis protein